MKLNELQDKVSGIEARQKSAKEKLDHDQRIDKCAYEAFENNVFGKELLNSYKMALLDPDGCSRMVHPNINYRIGQEDFVRNLLLMIDRHKVRMSGK